MTEISSLKSVIQKQIAELTAALKEKEMERLELWDAHVEASAAGARSLTLSHSNSHTHSLTLTLTLTLSLSNSLTKPPGHT